MGKNPGIQEQIRLAQMRTGVTDEEEPLKPVSLESPKLDSFETAVTFRPPFSPLSAHDALAVAFGQRAGTGRFLFSADSTVSGRFWVRSVVPWRSQPIGALSVLAPRRVVTQLATGLMHHFSLSVCAGEVTIRDGRKYLSPYRVRSEWEGWFNANAEEFGVRPLMVTATPRELSFEHGGSAYRIGFAQLEGALEVIDTERVMRRLLRGCGSYRRLGLGMLKLQS
jgi:hypothetical protein